MANTHPAMGWTRSEEVIAAAFGRIAKASPGDFVLVLSQQRTGSKFLLSLLQSVWGIRSANIPTDEVAHAHGISDRRLSQVQGEKAEKIHALRARLRASPSVTVFTIYRSFAERFVSHFALQKHRLASETDEALSKMIVVMRRQEREEEARWIADNLGAFFGAPPVSSLTDFLCFSGESAQCVLIRMERLNTVLERHLYPLVRPEEIAARRIGLGVPAKVRANSTEERGLTAFKERVEKLTEAIYGGRYAAGNHADHD